MGQPIGAVLDVNMVQRLGIVIAPEETPDEDLPLVGDPRRELGSRLLVKYIRPADMARYALTSGITEFPGRHYLTPTALHAGDVESALSLPPLETPVAALLLCPEHLPGLRGPRRVIGGATIEYLCETFKIEAIAKPGWGIRL